MKVFIGKLYFRIARETSIQHPCSADVFHHRIVFSPSWSRQIMWLCWADSLPSSFLFCSVIFISTCYPPSQDIWGQCCLGRLTCANQWSAAAPRGHVWLNGGPTACRAYHWEPVCPRVDFSQEKLVRSLLQITSKENHLQRMSISGTSPCNDLTSQGQRKIKMPK